MVGRDTRFHCNHFWIIQTMKMTLSTKQRDFLHHKLIGKRSTNWEWISLIHEVLHNNYYTSEQRLTLLKLREDWINNKL